MGAVGLLYPRVTIGTLPDDVLLEIFDFYMDRSYDEDEWHMLVHVCRQWRNVVFASPRRLGLRLLCTKQRSARKMTEVWPALPIIVKDHYAENLQLQGVSNDIAALKHNDRIREINIRAVPSLLLLKGFVMKGPFPALTSLELQSNDESAPVLTDSFIGGCAPRLQELSLDGIPFPEVGKLLLSANDLVSLRLWNIPHSGYISPEEMVISLSALTNLNTLFLGLGSPRPGNDRELERRHPPLLKRVVLPALTAFYIKCDSEYLEDTVGRVDAPLLSNLTITLFNQLIFDTPRLCDFIGRTETFEAPHRADVVFYGYHAQVILFRQEGTAYHKILELGVSCAASDWQLSSLAHVCSLSLPPLPTLERLGIHEGRSSQPQWQDDVEDGQWVELFSPFTTVKTLDISETFVGRVAPALQVLADRERATEVLPALQNIFLEGHEPPRPIQEAIGKFVAMRRLSGHPVAIHHRERGRWWHMRGEIY